MTKTGQWCGRVVGVAALGAGVALSGVGVALAEDANVVPPALLNTDCTLDQLMGATKVVDPPVYDAIVWKYSEESPWVQQHAIYHMNLFLQKDPADRQAEVDELATFFPDYAALFRTQESVADEVVAQCGSLPAQDAALWAPSAPAPGM